MSISGACDFGADGCGMNIVGDTRLYESRIAFGAEFESESHPSERVMRSESDLASAPDALVANGVVFSDHDRPR